jgi:hypothetical protein
MTTRNNKVREAILRLAGMREGWTLLADTIPDEFLNQVSIRISELEQQLAAMTSERDSESRLAKEYHDRAKELEAQLAASKDKICKNCKYWNMNIQTIGYCPEYQSGFCAQIYDKIDVNIVCGSDGYRVKDIETNIMFGCVLFERKQDA